MTQAEIKAAIEAIESEFLPYQLRYIYSRHRFKGYSKAVRCGISYAHSYLASKKRVFRDPRAKPINEIFASKNLMTAGEIMRYHRRWAEAWNSILPNVIDMSRWTTERAVYPGGDIMIVSSDPNSFRGMEADITLDEFAYHERQDELFSAAQSRIQWLDDGQVSLISSHSHPDTTFARLESQALRGKGPFSGDQGTWFRTTIYDAVEEGLALKVSGPHKRHLRKAA